MRETTCLACRRPMLTESPEESVLVCAGCEDRYPAPLLKAMQDPFDYALGLLDGTVIRFHSARARGEWVELETEGAYGPIRGETVPYPCPRGVAVRLSSIAWVADAPEGS